VIEAVDAVPTKQPPADVKAELLLRWSRTLNEHRLPFREWLRAVTAGALEPGPTQTTTTRAAFVTSPEGRNA
jgi:hypothetical protein